MDGSPRSRLRVAVIGSGISGLSAAWLLSGKHDVTVFEKAAQPGGHSLTADIDSAGKRVPVDMGFIVYNSPTYPNLTALFEHLGVKTHESEMSFGVSLDDGRIEYSGGDLRGLFAQPANLVSPRFWSMLADLVRFYRNAAKDITALEQCGQSLGDYLGSQNFGRPFIDDHLLPMAGAIWSAPAATMRDYPAAAFIRFFENHGLLKLTGRPIWRTVAGGSRAYVERLAAAMPGRLLRNCAAVSIGRDDAGVSIATSDGSSARFDHVVLATHADQALKLLAEPSPDERELLGAFRYSQNHAYLHTDGRLMPKRRAAWSSWSVLGKTGDAAAPLCVSYWMNRLQGLTIAQDVFVTLNPASEIRAGAIMQTERFEHPLIDARAIAAQRRLWSLQGHRKTWFCGAYFGSGFHEDGLQSGLAVAEALGGVRRPWSVPNESGRIHLTAMSRERLAA